MAKSKTSKKKTGKVMTLAKEKGMKHSYYVVEKHLENFPAKPNMPSYEKARKTFKWKDLKKEIDWFDGGKLNVAYNAIDRHTTTWRKNKVALYWVGDDDRLEKYTFLEMSKLTNKFANVLKKLGVKKGDRVFIFMQRTPEIYVAFLGALKIGAIAGTLFPAFGSDALKDRLGDCGASVLVTDSVLAKRVYPVKSELPNLKNIVLVDKETELNPGECSYKALMKEASDKFDVVEMDPEDYMYMLYTSGTTGKSKGVVHASAGVIQQMITSRWVLDLQEDDVYWCTADPGWVTGIVYGIIGPWVNGVSSVVHGGRFSPDVWYKIIQDFKVTVWYSAPTAVRMLMSAGADVVKKYDMSSLRYLNSVGEPLNPEAIKWSYDVFGLVFHDNWWQTETGSILIANYPSMKIKLGSMGRPFPGIEAAIIDDSGKRLKAGEEGHLAIKPGWPAMMRTIWKNQPKYDSCFKNGWYYSGDKAWMDKEGYFWFIGRADDVIKTSGERVGPFEVESALVSHPAVAEAGVIGKPDPLRGEIIKAFITLRKGYTWSDALKDEIVKHTKKHLAGHAYPREIEVVDKLPKTRSGKIMRRVLKAKELGLPIGDTATLED
ncbi:MAG: acetate--CoA ligase [archaeon]